MYIKYVLSIYIMYIKVEGISKLVFTEYAYLNHSCRARPNGHKIIGLLNLI
jgi:hypothetical protein